MPQTPENWHVAYTFDDVLLVPGDSAVLPAEVDISTQLTSTVRLNVPILSAAMETGTGARMAIALALHGGLGLIHYNMPERQQLSEVSRVKFHVPGMIQEPIKVAPEQLVGDIVALVEERKYSFHTFPVVDHQGRLVGLLSGHVVKPRYARRKVIEAMTPRDQVHTIRQKELGRDPIARAEKALATLTGDGWCQLGWIERANHRRVTKPLRYQVRWQLDTGEVRLEREQQR